MHENIANADKLRRNCSMRNPMAFNSNAQKFGLTSALSRLCFVLAVTTLLLTVLLTASGRYGETPSG